MKENPQPIYAEFGTRLAALRRKAGLSQADLAKRLGMPQSTYANYETGKRKITLELIDKFSGFYEVSPTFLVTGTERQNEDSLQLGEMDLIQKYRALGAREREAVDLILRRGAAAVVILREEGPPD